MPLHGEMTDVEREAKRLREEAIELRRVFRETVERYHGPVQERTRKVSALERSSRDCVLELPFAARP
jgi:hypothetical protein